jgi:cobalt-zinc-cadmium efflux system outer membrane protein
MFLTKKNEPRQFSKPKIFSWLLVPALLALFFIFNAVVFSQQQIGGTSGSNPVQMPGKLTSATFITQDGLSIERLIELGGSRRADLVAARQRLAVAEGRLRQAGLRPNPTLEAEYGSPKFLGGEPESDLSVGVSQTFELGGKRGKRVAVAQLEFNQARAEVLAFDRQFAAEIRQSYTNVLAAARQLDVLEKLVAADDEIIRVTQARLNEGDVAPLDLNLVRVESDRLKIQIIQSKRTDSPRAAARTSSKT